MGLAAASIWEMEDLAAFQTFKINKFGKEEAGAAMSKSKEAKINEVMGKGLLGDTKSSSETEGGARAGPPPEGLEFLPRVCGGHTAGQGR